MAHKHTERPPPLPCSSVTVNIVTASRRTARSGTTGNKRLAGPGAKVLSGSSYSEPPLNSRPDCLKGRETCLRFSQMLVVDFKSLLKSFSVKTKLRTTTRDVRIKPVGLKTNKQTDARWVLKSVFLVRTPGFGAHCRGNLSKCFQSRARTS